jgi:hypothetical protein
MVSDNLRGTAPLVASGACGLRVKRLRFGREGRKETANGPRKRLGMVPGG